MPCLQSLKCPKSCQFGRSCLNDVTVGDIISMRRSFWGDILEPAPKTKVRREKQREILTDAYDKFRKCFRFRIKSTSQRWKQRSKNKAEDNQFVDVCESAYLVALGRTGNMNPSHNNKVWNSLKKQIEKGESRMV